MAKYDGPQRKQKVTDKNGNKVTRTVGSNLPASVTSNPSARDAFYPRPAKEERMAQYDIDKLNGEIASAVDAENVTAKVELRDSGPVLVLGGEHVAYQNDADSDPLYGQFAADIASEYRAKGIETIPAGALSDDFDEYNSQLAEFHREGEGGAFDAEELARKLTPTLEKNGLPGIPVEDTVSSRVRGWYHGEITEERFTELAQEALDDQA